MVRHSVKREMVVKDSHHLGGAPCRGVLGKPPAITRFPARKIFCQQCKHCRNETSMV